MLMGGFSDMENKHDHGQICFAASAAICANVFSFAQEMSG